MAAAIVLPLGASSPSMPAARAVDAPGGDDQPGAIHEPTPPSAVPVADAVGAVGGFRSRLRLLFAAAALLIVATGAFSLRALLEFDAASTAVAQSYRVTGQLERLHATMRNAESDQRGYLLTGQRTFLQHNLYRVPAAFQDLDALAVMVANDPEQSARVGKLRTLVAARLEQLDRVLHEYDVRGFEAARKSLREGSGPKQMEQIESLIVDMRRVEEGMLSGRSARTERQSTMALLLEPLGVVLCLVVLGMAYGQVSREQRRRARAEVQLTRSHVDLESSLANAHRLTERMRQLNEFGELLQGSRSVVEVMAIASSALPSMLAGAAGELYLLNASQNQYESIGAWGARLGGSDGPFSPDDCWAIRRGQAHPAPDASHHMRCAHVHADAGDDHLCLPLTAQGQALGVLSLERSVGFGHEQLGMAQAVAEQLSLALANVRLQETLRTQSVRDPLTGLFNRRYLEPSMQRELGRATRRGQPLAVLMLDLDHFKRFNDVHGHDAGDTVLMQFAQLLQGACRDEDIVCRYGGEEFAVILPGADAATAFARAEHIRDLLAALTPMHRGKAMGAVTASIGIANFPGHGVQAEALFRAADQALYEAKRAGRNRVAVHGESQPLRLAGVA